MADQGTYYGTTDEGTDLYVGAGGSFTDENGIPLAVPSGTNINLSNGTAMVYGSGSAASPPTSGPSTSTASDTSTLAGLSDMFNAVGTAIGKSVTALNPAKPTTLPGQVGSYVYNPQTGQYVPAVQGTAAVGTQSLAMLLVFGLVAVLAIKALK